MKYIIDQSSLTAIANAVRNKSGTTSPILLEDIPQAITDLNQIPINPIDPTGINVYIVTGDDTEGSVNVEIAES